MDFDLNDDQRALISALDQLLSRHSGPLPVGSAAHFQSGDALERDLEEGGFYDIARQEGFGALEAVILIEAVSRSPYVAEVAGSALVLPMLSDAVLPRPIAFTEAPVRGPVRNLSPKGTLLVGTEEGVRVVDLSQAKVTPAQSYLAYPLARLDTLAIDRAPLLKGADIEAFRQWSRLAVAAETIGTMDAAIDVTTDYVRTRKQFGRALGTFQAIQHRLAECVTMIHAARLLVREAAWSGKATDALLAASYAQDAAIRVAYEANQFHGAIGLTLEYPIHYWTYRLRVLHGEFGGSAHQGQAAAARLWAANEPIRDPLG
jgi:alkylation response protein AidB-like acyl-CoA dehydrogenase